MNAMAPDNVVWSDLRRYVAPLAGVAAHPYLTDAEAARVERIRQRRLLFRGLHREYYVGEGRTQFPVATLSVRGRERGIYVPYNLLGLITRKGADLLFGEHPLITSEDVDVQAAIKAIDARSHFRRVIFEAAVTCSWAAEAFLEITASADRSARIGTPSVDEIFPVGDVNADGQHDSYRRYATANVGTSQSPIMLLLITTYRAGETARELWQLDKSGMKALRLTLDQWPAFATAATDEVEATGLDGCAIVWVPNEIIEGEAVGEYELPLIELQDLVNAKQSQLARILAIHANPRMYFATGSAENDGSIRAADEAFFGDTPDAMPRYLKMEGDPDAAMKDRDFAVAALCASAEMTPELLGLKNDATADSARKMRLAASSPLAKVERRTAYWQPAIQRAIALACTVELRRPIAQAAIGVEIRDGLPEDELDTAESVSLQRGADVMSDERALRVLGLDANAIKEEVALLQTKRASAMPDTLSGEPGVASSDPFAAQRQGESNG